MNGTVYRFHIGAESRKKYNFTGELFTSSGNVVLPDLRAVRLLTQGMNETRRASGDTRALSAAEMNAMGLIDEALHCMTRLYASRVDPRVFSKALAFLDGRLGSKSMDGLLLQFVEAFPPPQILGGERTAEQYLSGRAGDAPNREIEAEELFHLWLSNENPAFRPFQELFDDAGLSRNPNYRAFLDGLVEFFGSEPVFGPDNQDLALLLQSPMKSAPLSLSGQLEYIRTKWGHLLGDLLLRILMALDLLKEEEKMRFGGAALPEVLEYAGQASEPEAFSADKDWMPKVVMLAKNCLVWLDQLSKAHGRSITRLDQIPDEELDRMARAGFTALWLIGVWERSAASRMIKRWTGNPDAEASAYSLFDYTVAGELGGEDALRNLKERAWRRGIRLASDMVPNHTGIDSKWMIEHPERFLAYPRPYPPFPSYTFGGANLAEDERVGIFLEDHYYSRSDAAVVFKRVDFATGDFRYIYHGNDGTHMPWNDTAQLDFLNPDTREAVIRAILHVASLFPIIRFDAAMTLTKKHYQRLWFPEPGRGGDIPSRAECGISRFDFDHAMPREFWREVVDRAAAEAPDTLLLAEAFWLLEGFFVRTLGMHRVYNSAFMNMLKTEENSNYRQTIKNTMEFDPEVLRRFVNFMSNPDEDTAITQFGDGDKYFGVCTLMATMPGLPMFAHGQIEGLREKYGMEFRRAYWDERANDWLVGCHEREIFPLLKRRYLFAGVENFLLYDLFDPGGWVNEDVFAFSNRCGGERALVFYNNRYQDARGWARASAARAVKTPEGKHLVQRQLGEGLDLPSGAGDFVIFRDHASNLEYIRSCRELWEKGFYVELGAYQREVFLDFRLVTDDHAERWSRLAGELGGRGVPGIDRAFREMDLRPILAPFKALVNAETCRSIAAVAKGPAAELRDAPKGTAAAAEHSRGALLSRLTSAFDRLLSGIGGRAPGVVAGERARAAFSKAVKTLLAEKDAERALPVLLSWTVLGPLWEGSEPSGHPAISWLDEWMLSDVIRGCAAGSGWDGDTAHRSPALVAFLLESGRRSKTAPHLRTLLASPFSESFLRVNIFDGTRWFNKESLEILLMALSLKGNLERRIARKPAAPRVKALDLHSLCDLAEGAGFKWDDFLKSISAPPDTTPVRQKNPKRRGPPA